MKAAALSSGYFCGRLITVILFGLRPYMGVIPNQKMAFIFPISCILALTLPISIKYFSKCEGKGSFLKAEIKMLNS